MSAPVAADWRVCRGRQSPPRHALRAIAAGRSGAVAQGHAPAEAIITAAEGLLDQLGLF